MSRATQRARLAMAFSVIAFVTVAALLGVLA